MLVDRIARTPRITEFVLRPLGDAMRFWPGQYVQVGGDSALHPKRKPIRWPTRRGGRRDPPAGDPRRRRAAPAAGCTTSWRWARPSLSGPHGTFIGDPSVDTPVLCLAAGSGLAPILSLAEAALRRGFAKPVTLMFSAREAVDLYDRGLMRFWEAKYPNFRYPPTLTRERVDGLLHGRIPQVLGLQFADLSRHSVFVAGTTAFVDDCVAAAKALGAPGEPLIHTEGFFEQQQG